jgi:UDP-hydrolysing UDP-N-acetyl-D-glucosamine 2-epimerase
VRTIGVVTTGRADYGIYYPLLLKIQADPDLLLHLIVSGMHLSPVFGMTIDSIKEDGFDIGDKVELLLSSDSPEGISKSAGLGVIGYSQVYAKTHIDLLVLLGDRFEMHAAALAALPFKIPIAHIHGGEITRGAFDDSLRHSITKLSHLHFVSTEEYARRVIQMGENPWRVTLSGAPSLENLGIMNFLDREALSVQFGLTVIKDPFLLVTYHPVTLEYEDTDRQIEQLLAAIEQSGYPCVFTMPNADTHGSVIRREIKKYADTHISSQAVENLGTKGYFSLMKIAEAMVGNSSSGMVEAASFELPVVNVGNRQSGRVSGENIIHVGCDRDKILDGIHKALSPEFRAGIEGMVNPYGSGKASEKILQVLKEIPLDSRLIQKEFYDLNEGSG